MAETENIKNELQETGLTSSQMLQAVNQAIHDVSVGGQNYRLGSRSLTRANLSELKNLRNQLLQEQAQNENNADFLANTSVAVFEGR